MKKRCFLIGNNAFSSPDGNRILYFPYWFTVSYVDAIELRTELHTIILMPICANLIL